jgi:UDP-N-acetylglucosamine 1-carboxyvinyltransferase
MNFRIEGGKKLSGTVRTRTAKNSAVGLLCASLLNQGETRLKNLPRIEEVNRIIEVLRSIGVKVRWGGDDVIISHPRKFSLKNLDRAAAAKTRSIIMFLGPLIHFMKSFSIPHAGGCELGERTVRPHFFALEKLGIKIKTNEEAYNVSYKKLKPTEIVLYESGDTVTENVLMAAARIPGKTVIKFASANYQIQDLCHFLMALGIEIDGIGTTTLTVKGKPVIEKNIEFLISEDPIESMLFLSIAATTNSSITIEACPIDFLELELLKLEKMGFKYKILRRYKSKNGFTNLVDIKTYPSKLNALQEKIYARPFPGLNIDNLPFFVPVATQAKGQTLIHDWVYEERALYYLELNKLGAEIILADPHRVFIKGPTPLAAAEIICPPALRPAAIILIAMLAAKGTSILRNVYSINRGYEDLAKRLRKLGAKIEIINS